MCGRKTYVVDMYYGSGGRGMLSEKMVFFQVLDELARHDPQIVYLDPEHHITRIKMLVIDKLRKLGLQDLAERIRKRSNRKLIEWLKEWQVLKEREYEQVLKLYRQETGKEKPTVNMSTDFKPPKSNKTPELAEVTLEGYVVRKIKLDPRVIALYGFLKRHPVWKQVLTAAGINSLDDFINTSVIAYWRRNGVEITLINLRELEKLEGVQVENIPWNSN